MVMMVMMVMVMTRSPACSYVYVSLQISSAEIHGNDDFVWYGIFVENTLSEVIDSASNGKEAQSKAGTEFDFNYAKKLGQSEW